MKESHGLNRIGLVLVVVVLAVTTAAGLRARSAWTLQVSGLEGSGLRLDWVSALNANTAWVVGGTGYTTATILRTGDGGLTWQPQVSSTQVGLHMLAVADANTAWAAGNSGTIVHTVDGGDTWTSQTTPVDVDLAGITLVGSSTLWAVGIGGTIIKTVDGGATWSVQESPTGGNLFGVAALNANLAFVVGDEGIFKTTDGGATWSHIVDGLYKSITVAGATVWAVELFGNVAKSTDGGATWSVQPTASPEWLFRVGAVNSFRAWVVGVHGTILKTTDGGATWTAETSPTPNDLFGIATLGSGAAWISGEDGAIIVNDPGDTGDSDPVASPTAASFWLGLKNSDDVGTNFDILAETVKNGVVVGSGQINAVPGGGSSFNNAVQRAVSMVLSGSTVVGPGDALSLRLSVRIATGVNGHRSGTARLWYNDSAANSRWQLTVGGVSRTLYLTDGGALSPSPGSGPKKAIDVVVDRAVAGNPFKPFGTWTIVF
jgi:photosystem II stability/assembly factor-like uncharacterized protein